MTRDDILCMAREAGFAIGPATGAIYAPIICKTELERFAVLVAAAEREACAKVCEEIEDEYRDRESLRYAELKTDAQTGASDCAYRIRARGE